MNGMLPLLLLLAFQSRGDVFKKPGRVIEHKPRYLGLLIGINTYAKAKPLKTAVQDVTDLAALLKASYGFQDQDVRLLLNEEATKQGLISALEKIYLEAKEPDSVLIYYAGHGAEGRGQSGYWLPQDADGIQASYLSNSDLIGYVERIKARHVLVISDACFSGSIFDGTQTESGQVKHNFRELYDAPSRWVVTSGNRTTVDDRGPAEKHSPFAHYLLTRLTENQEPYLTPQVLVWDLVRKVARDSSVAQLPKSGTLPESGHQGGSFLFWNTGATRDGKPYPPPWESQPDDYLPFFLQALKGHQVLVENGGDPGMCTMLTEIGMQVTCDRGVRRRNGREIISYCGEIQHQSIAALIDYLGLVGYRAKTHQDHQELAREGDCGKAYEITIRN